MIEPSEDIKDLIWEVENDLDVYFWAQEIDLTELRKRVNDRLYESITYLQLRAMYVNVYCQLYEETNKDKGLY